ncbi:putative cyclase [Penicillium lagena]|uniref:putative cyclase n=1 Tax=Penicillium lagena TaxID=94218 RepID=UPI0025411780|nr:putative cyclase [Penicillium lagena]KAJ5609953.1 putative cyclase [Penicillium lagena]
MSIELPPFDALPLDKNGPPGNAWGLFGAADQLGRLNLLTNETVRLAASEQIKIGQRVSLDWPLSKPVHPFFNRQIFYHHIQHKAPRTVNDDVILFNTQCGTQWDGLRHFGYQDAKKFYNGVTQDEISSSETLGINVWVENGGVIGRGVLLDYGAWAARQGIAVDVFTKYGIPALHLQQLADEEGITFRQGDILFIRSGFVAAYEALSATEEADMPARKNQSFIGMESSQASARWFWENGFAAVAGDMPGFEQSPIWTNELQLHQWLLAGWGMPIGEMFYLEELAQVLKAQGRHHFFLTSVPLKVPGGVASPPNAMAIL